jgi:hypothetical protein
MRIKDRSPVNVESKWGLAKRGVPQGYVLGPLFFLLYISDLPQVTNYINSKISSKTILLTDDASLIVSNQDDAVLEANLHLVYSSMMKWFYANLLSLNMDKTCSMELYPKNTTNFEKKIIYNNKIIPIQRKKVSWVNTPQYNVLEEPHSCDLNQIKLVT